MSELLFTTARDTCVYYAGIISGIIYVGSGKHKGIGWNNWTIPLNDWCNIFIASFECRVVQKLRGCIAETMQA